MATNLSGDEPRVATATASNRCANNASTVIIALAVVLLLAGLVILAVLGIALQETQVQPDQKQPLSVVLPAARSQEGADHGVGSSNATVTTATTSTTTTSSTSSSAGEHKSQLHPRQHKPQQKQQQQQQQLTSQGNSGSSPAIIHALHELKPDYAARVASAIAAAKWYQPSSQSAAQATLADFLGVSTPTEWPKGGFLSGHASPCWRAKDQSSEVMCLPRFRMLGIAKSGTTTLTGLIGRHPGSTPTPAGTNHEVRFVTNKPASPTIEGAMRKRSKGLSDAAHKYPATIYGDCSPQLQQYNAGFWVRGRGTARKAPAPGRLRRTPTAYVRIAELMRGVDIATNAAVKYLLTVREPVARFYSAFKFYMEQTDRKSQWQQRLGVPGYEPSASYFHKVVVQQVREFQDCLYSNGVAMAMTHCIVDASRTGEHHFVASMYYVHMRQWMELTRTQMHRDIMVARLEDFGDPEKVPGVVNDVYEFLGLGRRPEGAMQKLSSRKKHSNAGASSVQKKFGPMLPETKALLSAVYAPFNKAFAELMGDPALLYQV